MKVYTQKSDRSICNELKIKLEHIRNKRNFHVIDYIEKKAELLNQYMKASHLKGCVVAISGGIDSAVTLGLIVEAARKKDGPIQVIKPLLLPCSDNSGVVNQDKATERGKELCKTLGVEPVIIDIHNIVSSIDCSLSEKIGIKKDDWAIGQLVPYTRTPILYYTTSLLTKEGYPSIICGTTNLDEGGYLGYVGKASDGMVDIQLISDIHKSEVYQVAKTLNLPKSILDITPTGDMFDSRVDEEVFGASYDFVELYLNYKNLKSQEQYEFLNSLSSKAYDEFKFYQENLETLHSYNKHKYFAKSPAVHLDLYDSKIKGGWDNYRDALKEIFHD